MDQEEEKANSQKCGIGPCKSQCLQRFAEIKTFLAVMCVVSCIQGAFAGYSASQNTTLEKRFSITSFLIGTINACFELGYIVCGIILNFYSHRAHVPRWLSLGLFVASVGAFLWALPFFIMPQPDFLVKYTVGKTYSNFVFIFILFIAQFCIGTGSSPILTLAPTFIDRNVHSAKSPPMLAALYASSALGPVFGFGLGTVTLNLPENLISNAYGFKPGDSQWIGAWWFGYMLLGLLLFLGGLALFAFPRNLRQMKKVANGSYRNSTHVQDASSPLWPALPGIEQIQPDEANNHTLVVSSDSHLHHQNGPLRSPTRDNNNGSASPKPEIERPRNSWTGKISGSKSLLSLPEAILRLLCNKIYMVATLTVTCEMFTVIGFGMFCPKYLENVYQINSTMAAYTVGGLVIPAGAIGILFGGFISRWLDRQRQNLALTLTVVSGCTFICLVTFLFLGCPKTPVAGINAPYPIHYDASVGRFSVMLNWNSTPGQYRLVDQCNLQLNCSSNDWKPVCDPVSGISFVSQCFAGCPQNGGACTCLPRGDASSLSNGLCPLKCGKLYWFVGCLTVVLLLTGIVQNPLIMMTLRSVSRDEAPFALAFQFAFVRIFAYVPSAIVYGRVMDSGCELWRQTPHGPGDCSFSNRETMMNNLTAMAGSFKFAGFLSYLLLYVLVRIEARGQPAGFCARGHQTRSLTNSQIEIQASDSTEDRPSHSRQERL